MFAARRGRPYVAAAAEPDTWDLTVTTPSASASYIVNIAAGSGVNIDIDWGDGGSVENFTTTGEKSHTFTNAGTYTVKISGSFTSGGAIRLGTNSTNRPYLKATGVIPHIPGLANFYFTFVVCTGLTSLPSDLFRYNNVSNAAFYQAFQACTGLTSLPSGLFRYNTLASAEGFRSTFKDCTGLTSLPDDLFRYTTAVSTLGFYLTFDGCSNLTTLPPLLFKYNTACSSFREVFLNCNKLQLRSDIFWDPSGDDEHLTRFLNQSVTFSNAMKIGTFTGDQGTAPALWTVDFGTGTPTKTACFTGHTTSSIDNHAAVVADGTWGLS